MSKVKFVKSPSEVTVANSDSKYNEQISNELFSVFEKVKLHKLSDNGKYGVALIPLQIA